MAHLVRGKSGVFSVRFRFGGCRFNRSLETTNEDDARAEKAKIERTI
jgi:hypothetical protein